MTTSTGDGQSHFWPSHPFGRWSVGSAVLFMVGCFGLMLATALGQTGGETFSDNWWLAGPAFVAGASALSALVSGVIAMIREHERSISLVLSTLIGLFVTVFVGGELLFPH